MEIKRTTEIYVETKRRFVIQQPESIEQIFCRACGEPTLTAEQAAAFFQTNCRQIYRLVEADAAHFAENGAGAVLICPSSLAAFFGDGAERLPAASEEER